MQARPLDASHSPHRRRRLLLVEEDQGAGDLLRSWLEEGLEEPSDLRLVTSEEEAWSCAAEGPVDLVLTDHRPGGLDGVALLARFRAERPHARRMLMSGSADLFLALRAINEAEAHAFLLKPLDRGEVLDAVRRILREPFPGRESYAAGAHPDA